MKRILGIDDEAEVEGHASDDESILSENEHDRNFLNSEHIEEYSKRLKMVHPTCITAKPEHKADPDQARKVAYDVIQFGNFVARFTPSINSETGVAMKEGHAELSLWSAKRDINGEITNIEPVKGIEVIVSAMPTKLQSSYVDLLTFNVNTLNLRNDRRVRDMQATVIGVLCSSFVPGIIIKATGNWMEFEGEKEGNKALRAMGKRFGGNYHVDLDTEAVVFHAGEFESDLRKNHSSKYADKIN
jgi:hypothetical protein